MSGYITKQEAHWRRPLSMGLFVCWGASLLLPALTMTFDGETARTLSGFGVLTSGWIAVTYFQFGWFANPALLATLVGLSSYTSRRWLAVSGGSLLIFTANTIDLFIRPEFHEFNSAGSGYILWTGVNIIAGIAALILAFRKHDVT